MVLLFLSPVLVGREGFGARNKGKGPVPLWSKCSCSRVCLEIQGGFDHCTEALITAFCSSPGSAPFSCPFIHSILSFLPTCVLTLGGIQLCHSVTPDFPLQIRRQLQEETGQVLWERTQCGRIRIHHSCPYLAETGGKGKAIC